MKSILMDRSGKNSNKPSVLSVQGLLMAYCNWSWDELVAYDLLATIKHVHDETEQQLQYVGHALVCATKSPSSSSISLRESTKSMPQKRREDEVAIAAAALSLCVAVLLLLLFISFGPQDKKLVIRGRSSTLNLPVVA
ncbi:hypothetical protein LguiB_018513 [Lonicera macranthoides]